MRKIKVISGIPKGGGVGEFKRPPPPEIPKVLQNRTKLNPIVKTVKIAEFRTPTPQDYRKKRQYNSKTTVGSQLSYISNDK